MYSYLSHLYSCVVILRSSVLMSRRTEEILYHLKIVEKREELEFIDSITLQVHIHIYIYIRMNHLKTNNYSKSYVHIYELQTSILITVARMGNLQVALFTNILKIFHFQK